MCVATQHMQGNCSTRPLVGIKQEEVNAGEQCLLRPRKEEELPNPETMHKHRKSQRGRRRLHTEQDSSESSGSDRVSSGNEWKPSLAEVNRDKLISTISSTVPARDLNAVTFSTSASLEGNTSGGVLSIPVPTGMQYSTVKEPTGEESRNQLEAVHGYTCKFCGKAFAKNMLLKHVNGVHEKLRNFPCDICGASFMYSAELRRHVDGVHKNLRSFPCDICGHSFQHNGALKTHVDSVHKNLRNFPCDICGFSFNVSSALRRHVDDVHKNLRHFTCDICHKSFKCRAYLKTHVSTVHDKLREFSCAICGRTFTQNSNLKSHIQRLHSGLRNFTCDVCGHSFQKKAGLDRHISTVHQILEGIQEKQENPI